MPFKEKLDIDINVVNSHLLLFYNQKVIIKLADFGFAKIDRGDLVTPQFTPYYVSPQVLHLCNQTYV